MRTILTWSSYVYIGQLQTMDNLLIIFAFQNSYLSQNTERNTAHASGPARCLVRSSILLKSIGDWGVMIVSGGTATNRVPP